VNFSSWRRISIGEVSRAGVRSHSIQVVPSARSSSSLSRRARVARSVSWSASASNVAWCARSRARADQPDELIDRRPRDPLDVQLLGCQA